DVAGAVAAANDALGGELANLAKDARFSGKRGTSLVVPTLGKLPARRLVLAGVGPLAKINAEAIRRAWGSASNAARDAGAQELVPALRPAADGIDAARALAAAVEGARLAPYRFPRYYGQARKDDPAPREIASLAFTGEGLAAGTAQDAITRGDAAAAGVALA